MKISISFLPDEREKVMELVTAAKQILRISRFHAPKQPKGDYYHIHMTTNGR